MNIGSFAWISNSLWYLALIMCLAFVVLRAEYDGLAPQEAFITGLFGMGGGLLVGSIMATGGLPPGISSDPASWIFFIYAEKAMFGVVFGGGIFASIWLLVRRQSILKFADVAAPAVALAYVIARLDCFAHGHCFGITTDIPWSVSFVSGTQAFVDQLAVGLIAADASRTLPVHPTQLYHALLGVAAFLVLLRMKADVPGRRFAAALMLYGAGRFVIQFLRGDSHPVLGPLDVNHIAALVMLAMGIALWRFRIARLAVPDRGLTT